MTRIKICGTTNLDDARAAVDYGADALGFIGVPASPRFIADTLYHEIAPRLPIFVRRVVVVHKPEDADSYRADYVQHYADSTSPSPRRLESARHIRAFRIRDERSLDELAAYPEPVGAILLDAYHPDILGGSGETFNWDLAVAARRLTDKPIILAGGLTPDNVQDALEAVRPYAVDVASGVESAPGIKDHTKLKAFIRAVRAWDLRQ